MCRPIRGSVGKSDPSYKHFVPLGLCNSPDFQYRFFNGERPLFHERGNLF